MEKEQTENNDESVKEDQIAEIQVMATEEPEIKKSGGATALLLSLVALGLSGYLFYQEWSEDKSDQTSQSLSLLKQLETNQQQLQSNVTNNQGDIKGLKSQTSELMQQWNELNAVLSQRDQESGLNESSELPVISFDNSSNEQAIVQLTNQLAVQTKLIEDLQQQLSEQSDQQVTQQPSKDVAHEVTPDTAELIQKRAAIHTLLTAQSMLSADQAENAAITIEKFITNSSINEMTKNKMGAVVDQIRQLEQPDLEKFQNQLNQIQQSISNIQLPTVETTEESSWYDRFISVKKISDEGQINSSAQLMIFKAQLDRMLFEASFFLKLKNQSGWQSSLEQAATLLSQEMPNQKKISNQLTKLAGQSIVVTLPNSIKIQELIDELKGLR